MSSTTSRRHSPTSARRPRGHGDQAALRPVGLRFERDRGRVARSRHRRRADGPDHPAVPRLVALDADRARLDPALPDDLTGAAGSTRPHHQRDDAGRAGARGQHPRRRRDGGDREHLPPVRGGQALPQRRGRGRSRHRQAGADLDAVDLRRLRLGLRAHRHAEVSVHAAGARGRVRDANLLPPHPHARAGDDRRAGGARIPPAPRRRSGRPRRGRIERALVWLLSPSSGWPAPSAAASRRGSTGSTAAMSGCSTRSYATRSRR